MVKEQQSLRYAQRLVDNEYLEHGDEDVVDPTQWGLFERGQGYYITNKSIQYICLCTRRQRSPQAPAKQYKTKLHQ